MIYSGIHGFIMTFNFENVHSLLPLSILPQLTGGLRESSFRVKWEVLNTLEIDMPDALISNSWKQNFLRKYIVNFCSNSSLYSFVRL